MPLPTKNKGEKANKGENKKFWDKKYEEAFRIHNTGKSNGKTFDPDYVQNGLKFIEYFNKK